MLILNNNVCLMIDMINIIKIYEYLRVYLLDIYILEHLEKLMIAVPCQI